MDLDNLQTRAKVVLRNPSSSFIKPGISRTIKKDIVYSSMLHLPDKRNGKRNHQSHWQRFCHMTRLKVSLKLTPALSSVECLPLPKRAFCSLLVNPFTLNQIKEESGTNFQVLFLSKASYSSFMTWILKVLTRASLVGVRSDST